MLQSLLSKDLCAFILVDFSHIEYIVDTSTMLKSNF